jgi:hypothetical protein
MPKRTNDFQTLIRTIYEQIVPEGGSVTESGMVPDREAGILREVDILVEHKYAGHEFRLIVECRDHSRSQTVDWIDGLIGKVKSLDVDKVVAVSSKGFSRSALRKAKENGIETLTLEEANETDWAKFPIRPGLVVMTDDIYRIHDVLHMHGEEYLPITALGLNSQVEAEGEVVGDLAGVIEYFFQEYLAPQLDKHKKEHFSEIFKTREDVEKPLWAQSEHDWTGICVVSRDGTRTELSKVKFVVFGNRRAMGVEQEHRLFNERMVSTGRLLDADGTTVDFSIVQDPDTEKIHLRWTRSTSDDDA